MHIKQYLNFSALRDAICQCATGILDGRQQSKVKYSLHDCLMSAWAMMHPDMRQVLHLATAMASS